MDYVSLMWTSWPCFPSSVLCCLYSWPALSLNDNWPFATRDQGQWSPSQDSAEMFCLFSVRGSAQRLSSPPESLGLVLRSHDSKNMRDLHPVQVREEGKLGDRSCKKPKITCEWKRARCMFTVVTSGGYERIIKHLNRDNCASSFTSLTCHIICFVSTLN